MFGGNLPCDLEGYVPEAGDNWDDLEWPHGYWDEAEDSYVGQTADMWDDFVKKAVEETREAEEELREWRKK
jgi:hypothetical protein